MSVACQAWSAASCSEWIFQRVYELDEAPQWTLMTIYELEGDDPEPIIDSIRAASGSGAMPASDALTKAGMIQAAGHQIACEFP